MGKRELSETPYELRISRSVPTRLCFLVPTRQRGNAFATRQRRGLPAYKHWTLARREWVPTPARGNQKILMYNDERRRVGTRKHWTLARREWVPTPARGNQKILMYNDERRRVGTRK